MKLYQSLLTRFPDDKGAAGIQASVIKALLKQNKGGQADSEIDLLFSRYNQPAESFIEAVDAIIQPYDRMNDSGKVIELCNRILAAHPDHEHSLPIRTKLIKAYLELN